MKQQWPRRRDIVIIDVCFSYRALFGVRRRSSLTMLDALVALGFLVYQSSFLLLLPLV